MKYVFFSLIIVSSAFAIGCGGPEANISVNKPVANTATTPANANTAPNVNLPPPGANANSAPASNGSAPTPTPGIPSKEQQKRAQKAGPTPTPGIPSAEEIRRQMSTPKNPNDAPPGNSPPMMKGQPMMKTTKTPHPED